MPEIAYDRHRRYGAAKKKAGTSPAFSDCLLRIINTNNTYQIRQVQVCVQGGLHLAFSAR